MQAPNYFRFTGDGAQWNAGLGDILYNNAGWDTVPSSPTTTASAGRRRRASSPTSAPSVAVVQRVFPPLNTTDYSSFIAQLPNPDEVDGYFWAVGGTGTQASLEAFVNAKGDLTGKQHAGNLFFNPALASALGPDIAGAYIGGFASFAGDVQTPEINAYAASADAAWDTLVGGTTGGERGGAIASAGFGFAYGYYLAGMALIQALNEVNGDLSDNHKALRDALSKMTLKAPFGTVTLDKNRQAIVDTTSRSWCSTSDRRRLQDRGAHQGCRSDLRWHVRRTPRRRRVTPRVARLATCRGRQRDPRRRRRAAERAPRPAEAPQPAPRPWLRRPPPPHEHGGDDDGVAEAEGVAPLVQLRDVVVAFGGLLALGGIDLDVAQGERLAVLGPNGAGKTTLFNVVAGDIRPTAGTVTIKGVDCTLMPSRRRPSLGVARTYQRTRLFAGLTVEDNLYLALIGKQGGTIDDGAGARRVPGRRRAGGATVWLGDHIDSGVGDLSHGQQRQLEVGMAMVTEPDADDARRAGLRSVPRRTRTLDRTASELAAAT